MSMLEAKVEGLALDMTTNSPVVILAPLSVNKVLPIWIGHAEAWGIAIQLTGIESQRPMTYDLLKEIIIATKSTIVKVEITELKEQTFYAKVHVKSVDGSVEEIDARPSDSIALALKMQAPIFVCDSLLNVSEEQSQSENSMPTVPESLRERLKKINPEDFGNYSL